MRMNYAVSDWLSTFPHIRNIQPVTVAIGNNSWVGAQYDSVLQYTANMNIVLEGKKLAGEEYTNTRIYLVGAYPKHSRTCYRFEGDERDWYIASYMEPKNLTPEFASSHPFGISWQLAPWDLPDSTIDQHEEKEYKRIQAIRK